MRVELDMFRASHFTINKKFSWVCVVIEVSRVYCTLRALGLSRDTKYLSFMGRMWVFERDSHMK